jgi:alpha-tubulin suppressor-like RCC1 family protein
MGAFYAAAPLGALVTLMACSSSEEVRPVRGGERAIESDGGAPRSSNEDGGDAGEPEPPPPYDFEVKCTAEPCATAIAAHGGAHACAVLKDGSVRCWGSNVTGQLGTGGSDAGWIPRAEAAPRPVPGVANAKSVAVAGDDTLAGTTCVVSAAGAVACFGSDTWGQLGRGTGESQEAHPEPAVVEGLQAKSVTLTSTFALAIDTRDRLWSWGANDATQLARTKAVGDASAPSVAAVADRVSGSVRSCSGTSTTGFVVGEDGALLSWGGSASDHLGRVTSARPDARPSAIALEGVSGLATGTAHACAVGRGRVHCWGQNDHGQLGTGTKADSSLPALVILPPGVAAVAVAAGGDGTCMLAASGEVYCWGANGGGQLGAAMVVGQDQTKPVRIEGLGEAAVAVAVMDRALCALLRGGSVVCSGDNATGQLGRGSRDAELHPEPGPVVFE